MIELGESTEPLVEVAEDVNEVIEQSRVRALRRLSDRDVRASLLLGGAFLATAAVMANLIESHRSPSTFIVVGLVLAYAVASRVEFEVGTGIVVPTEPILVPMLFVLPVATVPLWVALALVVGRLPSLLAGKVPAGRLPLILVK